MYDPPNIGVGGVLEKVLPGFPWDGVVGLVLRRTLEVFLEALAASVGDLVYRLIGGPLIPHRQHHTELLYAARSTNQRILGDDLYTPARAFVIHFL